MNNNNCSTEFVHLSSQAGLVSGIIEADRKIPQICYLITSLPEAHNNLHCLCEIK